MLDVFFCIQIRVSGLKPDPYTTLGEKILIWSRALKSGQNTRIRTADLFFSFFSLFHKRFQAFRHAYVLISQSAVH